jgi:hypothetical protein
MTMTKPGGTSMRACTPAAFAPDWSAYATRIHVLANTAFGGARRPQELPT